MPCPFCCAAFLDHPWTSRLLRICACRQSHPMRVLSYFAYQERMFPAASCVHRMHFTCRFQSTTNISQDALLLEAFIELWPAVQPTLRDALEALTDPSDLAEEEPNGDKVLVEKKSKKCSKNLLATLAIVGAVNLALYMWSE